VQLARYAEHIVATLNKEVRIEDAPASDGCTTTTTTTILSIKTVVTNMLTTNSSTKRADLKRQAHVNEPTTEFRCQIFITIFRINYYDCGYTVSLFLLILTDICGKGRISSSPNVYQN